MRNYTSKCVIAKTKRKAICPEKRAATLVECALTGRVVDSTRGVSHSVKAPLIARLSWPI